MECVFCQICTRLGGRSSACIFLVCDIHSDGDKVVSIVFGGLLQRGRNLW
jgi:hypothetical protein